MFLLGEIKIIVLLQCLFSESLRPTYFKSTQSRQKSFKSQNFRFLNSGSILKFGLLCRRSRKPHLSVIPVFLIFDMQGIH